jgi:hypothetical protein
MDTQSIVTSNTGVQKIGKPVSDVFPQVKDVNVNLRDRLNDILFTEKHNLVNYQVAINEMLNDDLRNLLIDNRNKTQGAHCGLVNRLFDLGEYQADAANSSQIKDAFEVFNNYKTQLPYQY